MFSGKTLEHFSCHTYYNQTSNKKDDLKRLAIPHQKTMFLLNTLILQKVKISKKS